jgi:opacity protein-like surface antigen
MTRTPTVCAWTIVLALTISTISWGTQAIAKGSPSVAELQQAIAALEARVAALAPLEARITALEKKLQRSETVSGQQTQEASMPRPLLVSLANSGVEPAPMMLAATTQPARLPEENGWSGLYWGASFGYGSAFSKSKYQNVGRRRYQSTSADSSTDVQDDGSTEMRFDTYKSVEEFVTNAASDGTDRREGALADLYLGASTHLTPRIVVGAQVEGTLSEMTFGSTINRHDTTRKRKSTDTSFSSGDDFNYQSKDSSRSSGKSTDIYPDPTELQLDWMVSVIGRAGVLATRTTFLYGLAGWSYGHFDVEEMPYDFGHDKIQDFHANGPTVGGGIEQKLSSKWSLRAEYRYTDFGRKRLSARGNSSYSQSESGSDQRSSSDSSSCCGGNSSSSTGTDTDSDTFTSTSRSNGSIKNDMHVGRVGVSRYFTWGD